MWVCAEVKNWSTRDCSSAWERVELTSWFWGEVRGGMKEEEEGPGGIWNVGEERKDDGIGWKGSGMDGKDIGEKEEAVDDGMVKEA
jgi:hypothetical protein